MLKRLSNKHSTGTQIVVVTCSVRTRASITVVAGASRPSTEARRLSHDQTVVSAPILSDGVRFPTSVARKNPAGTERPITPSVGQDLPARRPQHVRSTRCSSPNNDPRTPRPRPLTAVPWLARDGRHKLMQHKRQRHSELKPFHRIQQTAIATARNRAPRTTRFVAIGFSTWIS